MYCVHTHPGFASGDWTFHTKWNVTQLQPETWYIKTSYYHFIRTLAWFLPEATHFSEKSSENLPEVYSLLIMQRNFWVYTFSVFSVYGMLADWLSGENLTQKKKERRVSQAGIEPTQECSVWCLRSQAYPLHQTALPRKRYCKTL